MADALVLDHRDPIGIAGQDFQECARLQLPPGRSYVVLAKGLVSARKTTVMLRLEAHGATDETRFSQSPLDPSGEDASGTFSLVVATTVEDDPDLFVIAKLSASVFANIGSIGRVKLVALTVDNLAITTA